VIRFGSTSITVTGIDTPSGVNIRVIPLFLPTKPMATAFLSVQFDRSRCHVRSHM